MKNFISKFLTLSLLLILSFGFVACGKGSVNSKNGAVAEKIELTKSTLGDVEFENSKETKIKQDGNIFTVSGIIDAMSESQKVEFGNDDATHVVSLKFSFDKERTISSFEIKGEVTKVYADSKDVENYVGSISELLDSEEGEDAFCFLILSAKTPDYKLKATYSDGTESTIELKIVATLATAVAE